MPSMTFDGLGGEEVRTSGTALEAQSAFFLGSVTTTSIISGNQIFSTGSVQGARIADATGRIITVTHGSPGLGGAQILVGSFATGAGSTAAVPFRVNFAAANSYVFHAWPQSGPGTAGSMTVFTSGTANNGKNTSGVNVVGAASVVYDYFAIGL